MGQDAVLAPWQTSLILALDRVIFRLARRWLWLLNALSLPFILLPILAPCLMAAGQRSAANVIYRAFSFVCHERADRCFHLFGYKLACCERCTAIYMGLFVGGLIFGPLRQRLKPAALVPSLILCFPIVADGLTQLAGMRESNWELRVITGILFAIAVCWYLLPRLDDGFAGIVATVEERFGRLVAEGRAAPL